MAITELPVSDWNATQYLKFEPERTRPATDLLARVPEFDPATCVDLGCGPGNSTELLVRRFPKARITGIDRSQAMLAAARLRLPQVRFEQVDIADWAPAEPYDLIFANASLQSRGTFPKAGVVADDRRVSRRAIARHASRAYPCAPAHDRG